ncbi:hypothetical protein LP43_0877 [Methylophaga thiooxydans]|uniref:Uncharacterized protein n=1 Tax=Methylophaga thiooxydans TaxID=392484 RepID=A0A0A0BHZ1_9GAMM|nr:hypothetical protein [Methylophaga thiooxydans]KGM07267.1 hypothetical protein LP43_0877 [Methylophaga thiooxydans]
MSRIEQLLQQIRQLEEELLVELNQRSQVIGFTIKGKRVEFERSIRLAHKRLKYGVWRWLFGIRPINIITAPIIYAMIVPLVLIDVLVSFYQYTCFPIYGISRVKRDHYIVFDRHHLSFLNIFERLHCLYCAYGNGVVAYIREILARTEQYFCPIKHARKVLGTHERYYQFIEYGDATDYHQRLQQFRKNLAKEE